MVNQPNQTVGQRAPPTQFGTYAPKSWSLGLESSRKTDVCEPFAVRVGWKTFGSIDVSMCAMEGL